MLAEMKISTMYSLTCCHPLQTHQLNNVEDNLYLEIMEILNNYEKTERRNSLFPYFYTGNNNNQSLYKGVVL